MRSGWAKFLFMPVETGMQLIVSLTIRLFVITLLVLLVLYSVLTHMITYFSVEAFSHIAIGSYACFGNPKRLLAVIHVLITYQRLLAVIHVAATPQNVIGSYYCCSNLTRYYWQCLYTQGLLASVRFMDRLRH